jgi:hypothetical protein
MLDNNLNVMHKNEVQTLNYINASRSEKVRNIVSGLEREFPRRLQKTKCNSALEQDLEVT